MSKFPSISELRSLSIPELEELADQLRTEIPKLTNEKKGHMESSLSVTELTIALHYSLNTPEDALIWDVGHQAYVHKVLTNRSDEFATNRQLGGISGFPRMAESEFDAFGTGHSSTSISAISGMAMENRRKGLPNRHVAVIGDGALTGGMAYEALNFLGSTQLNVLIILNDNRKAIDANVGALHEMESYPEFFKSLNIQYLGEVDGHDLKFLLPTLKNALSYDRPRVLRVRTESTSLEVEPSFKADLPFHEVFGQAVKELLGKKEDITVITPAMLSGAGLKASKELYPARVIDVGIAEQHAATFAAGIAASGGRPILHLYSTFAQRAYDQIIHDIALQNLPVTICIDRAGLVGADGPTHHGAFDLAFLSAIPNLTITSPRNGIELRNALHTALQHDGPFVVRYPRDTEARFDAEGKFDTLEIGKAISLKEGAKLCIMSTGTMSRRALEVAEKLADEGVNVGVMHHLFVTPLDHAALSTASKYTHWLVLEDSSRGGLTSLLSTWLHEHRVDEVRLSSIHLPHEFIEHGSVEELHQKHHMDSHSVLEKCKELLHH